MKPTTDRNPKHSSPHRSSTTDHPSSFSSSCLLRHRGRIETHHRSKPTTKDDDSLGPHGVSSVFSRLLRQKKDPIPPHMTTLCPDGVISVASRLLRQKNDANPPWTMSISVLTASPPSCLIFSKNDANPPQTTSVSVSVLTEITSQGLLSSYGLLCLTLFELSTGKHFFRLSDLDSTNPYTLPSNFVDLLYSQQDCVPFPYENFSHGGDLRSSQLPVFNASSQATTNGDHPTKRPPGVKAAKGAGGKRTIVDQLGVSDFHGMWSIKEKDLAAKERL
ncbi:hypothetical protein F2Q68_00011200 [Brassica cretica]|uniref:Uncharacterized protein n=1 Tax=Brassica cretica TaxID=69181 RepID=A0A8S9L3Y7_BRACR|nr:hypothetical protein F2Q68_00011200 [Brassica cretica]